MVSCSFGGPGTWRDTKLQQYGATAIKPTLPRMWAPIGLWPATPGLRSPPLCLALPRRLRASGVTIALLEVELAVFARQAGASPAKQIVLDRATWHSSVHLRLPDLCACCFYRRIPQSGSPPSTCGHCGPLTNAVLVNRDFATRGARGHPTRPLRRAAGSCPADPLHHTHSSVVPTYQETTRTQVKDR